MRTLRVGLTRRARAACRAGRVLRTGAAVAVATALLAAAPAAHAPTAAGAQTARAPSAQTATADAFADTLVTRSGSSLMVGRSVFRFVGFNLHDAAATTAYQCDRWPRQSEAELTASMRYLHDKAGATVLRFWAYQTYTRGGTDWSGVDRVLRVARATGMKVVPVLEDGPGYCTTGSTGAAKWRYANDSWYSDGYRVRYGTAALSYRDYAARVVAHYRGDPTIAAWMLMNEAETSARDASGRSVLVRFAADMAGVVKQADPTHLLTLGTQSNGAAGASGSDFRAVYSVPGIDVAEVHDWASRGSDTAAMPGSPDGTATLPAAGSAGCQARDAPLACSFAIARQIRIPLVVGESGIAAGDAAARSRRATLMTAKLRAAFAGGAAGYLVWQFGTAVDTEQYDVLATTGDPLVGVLSAAAGLIRAADQGR